MPIGTLQLLFTALNSENREEVLNVAVARQTGAIWVYVPATTAATEERQVWLAEALPPADPAISLGFFRHFKGGTYRALFLAHRATAPEEAVVVYISLIHGTVWVRPAPMWTEVTDRWPDGVSRPRFVPETADVAALFSPTT